MKNLYTLFAWSMVVIFMMNKAYGGTEVWTCPEAPGIKVTQTYQYKGDYTWNARTVSSLKHSIPLWGIHNPQYPEALSFVELIDLKEDGKLMMCAYTTKDKGYKEYQGNITTLGKEDWQPLPGKNCHFTHSVTNTCNGSVQQCAITCDLLSAP